MRRALLRTHTSACAKHPHSSCKPCSPRRARTCARRTAALPSPTASAVSLFLPLSSPTDGHLPNPQPPVLQFSHFAIAPPPAPDVGDFQCIPANIGVKVKVASTRGDLSANGYFYTFHKESCQTEGTFNMLPCNPETESCYAVEPCESENMECCHLAPGYFQQSTEMPSTSQSELQLTQTELKAGEPTRVIDSRATPHESRRPHLPPALPSPPPQLRPTPSLHPPSLVAQLTSKYFVAGKLHPFLGTLQRTPPQSCILKSISSQRWLSTVAPSRLPLFLSPSFPSPNLSDVDVMMTMMMMVVLTSVREMDLSVL